MSALERRPGPGALALAALAVTILVVNRGALFSPHLLEWGDLALNALQIDAARQGAELLGPYSRFGFHHPGPVSFYYLAWTEPLFFWIPTPLGRHLTAQLLLNFALLGLLFRQARALFGNEAAALLLVLPVVGNLCVLAGGAPLVLWEVWGPSQVAVPVVLFVVATARLSAGRWDAAPPAALAAVLAGHNHVGTLALIGPLGIAAVIAAAVLLARRKIPAPARRGRLHLAIAGAVVAAGFAPVLVEQLGAGTGNLTRLVRFLIHTPRGDHSPLEAVTLVASSFTDWLLVVTPPLAAAAAAPAGQLVALGVLAVAAILQLRRDDEVGKGLIPLLWAALFCSVASAYLVKGRLEPYLFRYAWGLAGVHFFLLGRELVRRLPQRLRSPGTAVTGAIAATVALVIWIAAHPVPVPGPDDRAQRFLEGVRLDPSRPVMLLVDPTAPDNALWIEAAGLNLALERAGYAVRVPSDWIALYTGRLALQPDEQPQTVRLSRTQPAAVASIDLGGLYAFRTD